MAQFDIEGARAAGHSDSDIRAFLLAQPGVEGARSAGYGDDEILKELGWKDQQMTGPLRLPAMAGKALATGVVKTLGAPGDLEQWAVDRALDFQGLPSGTPAARSAAMGPTTPWSHLPTSNELMNFTAPVTKAPGLDPSGTTENYLNAGATGVGAALPMLLTGGAAAPLVVGGAASGLASQGAHDLFPDVPWAPMAAGIAAGGLAGGATQWALAGNQVARAARVLGPASTWQEAGTSVQQAARDWLKTSLPAKVQAAWDPVDALVPGTTPVPLNSFASTLRDINTKGGQGQALIDALGTGATAKKLENALNNKTPVGVGAALTWDDVRAVRTTLGDAMRDPRAVKDISQQELAGLYKSLSEDLRTAAGGVGPEALDAFNSANVTSSKLYDFANGPVSRLVRNKEIDPKDMPPEVAAAKLLSGASKGGSELTALRSEMPDAVNNLSAALLRDPDAARKWAKLSPEGKQALIPDPRMRSAVDAALPRTSGVNAAEMRSHAWVGARAGPAIGAIWSALHGGEVNEANLILGGAYGELAGLAVPPIYQAAKYGVTHPGLLRSPIAAGVAANQLFGAEAGKGP